VWIVQSTTGTKSHQIEKQIYVTENLFRLRIKYLETVLWTADFGMKTETSLSPLKKACRKLNFSKDINDY
jgi:hypothetical protein